MNLIKDHGCFLVTLCRHMRKVVFRDGKFEFFLNQYALNNARGGGGEGAAGDVPLGLRNLKPIREEREPGN